MVLIDTSVLIDVLRDREDAGRRLSILYDANGHLEVPVTVIQELWYGLERSGAIRQRRRLASLLQDLPTVPFDAPAAAMAGQLHARLADAGRSIDVEDLQIAALGVTRMEPVLTANVRHFTRIQGLEVLDWRAADPFAPVEGLVTVAPGS